MATNPTPATSSPNLTNVSDAPAVSAPPSVDLRVFRASDRGKALLGWLKSSYTSARDLQLPKREQWNLNIAKALGESQVKLVRQPGTEQYVLQKVITPQYRAPKKINRVRGFARTEHSKFVSNFPNVVSVPASGEDQDQRSAYAAQQVWESYSSSKLLRVKYEEAQWWRVHTGNGFLKTYWDPTRKNSDGSVGDIEYASITPYHLFVPDLRQKDLEKQPYLVEAQIQTIQWARSFFADALKGENLAASASSQIDIMDEAYLDSRSQPRKNQDSVLVLEFWVKPGATDMLPDGGLVMTIEDTIVHFQEGIPYQHRKYPYTHFRHLETPGFYGASPIEDIIPVVDEYNETRGQISLIGRRMGNPQFIYQEGSLDPNKMTNAPGSMIPYRMGFQPPQQLQPAPLPAYMGEQLDRQLQDIEDLTGQHEVSKGSAPTGVTAGTALAFLKESDDNFLTPQHHNTEAGVEDVAVKSLVLFNQYVDVKRRIRVIGADGAFDTEMLSGADIADGLDVRVEEGTSIGQSMAAKRAQVMDLVDRGLVDPQTALKMMEIGGVQKILDIVNVSEKQAQRENVKMKTLQPTAIEQAKNEFVQTVSANAQQNGLDPSTPEAQQLIEASVPPMIMVNDFDMHEVHIEVHNRFRMSQEYEILPDEIKQQFAQHVQQHQMYLQQLMQNQMAQQAGPGMAPGAEGAPGVPGESAPAPEGAGAPPEGGMPPGMPPGM